MAESGDSDFTDESRRQWADKRKRRTRKGKSKTKNKTKRKTAPPDIDAAQNDRARRRSYTIADSSTGPHRLAAWDNTKALAVAHRELKKFPDKDVRVSINNKEFHAIAIQACLICLAGCPDCSSHIVTPLLTPPAAAHPAISFHANPSGRAQ
jgi:hypothetical protein